VQAGKGSVELSFRAELGMGDLHTGARKKTRKGQLSGKKKRGKTDCFQCGDKKKKNRDYLGGKDKRGELNSVTRQVGEKQLSPQNVRGIKKFTLWLRFGYAKLENAVKEKGELRKHHGKTHQNKPSFLETTSLQGGSDSKRKGKIRTETNRVTDRMRLWEGA